MLIYICHPLVSKRTKRNDAITRNRLKYRRQARNWSQSAIVEYCCCQGTFCRDDRPVDLTRQTISDIIRTCLGPRAMLKMLLDPMGGIVLTNDGNAILREVEVAHPAAKSMIELSRTQDEEVGDGTTSVIIMGTCGSMRLAYLISVSW